MTPGCNGLDRSGCDMWPYRYLPANGIAAGYAALSRGLGNITIYHVLYGVSQEAKSPTFFLCKDTFTLQDHR